MAEITQAQYNTAKQNHRNISIRIDLLNFSKQVIESIEGRVISGTLTSDANSNMRNTCDIQMVVTDSSFNVESEGKIWMDRYIQIYVGVEDVHTKQIVWTNKGIYLLNQPTYSYSAESNTLSFQGVDMMALLTDMRGGMLTEAYLIPSGSNVHDVIITILTVNGFNEYVVTECENSDGSIQPVPYDMNFDVGSTWWDVLEALQGILPNYQMYFDVDGVFHYEPTPYQPNETVRMDDDIWRQNVISESVSYDFESVKNSVKVLGRTHSVNYYATEVSIDSATINLTIPGLTELAEGALIGFELGQSVSGEIALNVNNLGSVKLAKMDGSYVTSLAKSEYWTASYDGANQVWQFLGHVQAVGEWMDDNPHSPFFVGNPAGEIKIVLYGGDYDNIMSDELATQRAEWEIYQRCRMNDSITLNSVPIYWSEVNWMVAYTPLGQDVVNQYLIRSITTDLTYDGTQTYNLIRWYPYYIQYVPANGSAVVVIDCSDSTGVARPSASAKADTSATANSVASPYSKYVKFASVVQRLIGGIISNGIDRDSAPAAYVGDSLIYQDGDAIDRVTAPALGYLDVDLNISDTAIPRNVALANSGDKSALQITQIGDAANPDAVAADVDFDLPNMASIANVTSRNTVLAEFDGQVPFVFNVVGNAQSDADANNETEMLFGIAANAEATFIWEYPEFVSDGVLRITQVYSTDTSASNTIIIE